jgi:transposase
MLIEILLPKSAGLCLGEVVTEPNMIVLHVSSGQTEAICPGCTHRSKRVHSHYTRTVADLPWAEWPVYLKVLVQRFFCDNPACRYKTFAERFAQVVARYARRTLRLATRQQQTAYALGGEAGAKLAPHLSIPTSGDTLLRLIRKVPPVEVKNPRVLGVDDWAWAKGHRYGTILVDLERHRPIDLLPDRSADSLAAWLQAHPGVEIVCRDRAREYIDGVTQGAPQAQQVADRWHLLQNLREALERLLDQHSACLYAAANEPVAPVVEPEPPPSPQADETPPPASSPALTQAQQKRQATRDRRLARYQAVLELQQQGLSRRAIARQLGLGYRTIQRYLDAGTFPEMAQRRQGCSILDQYLPYLQQRWGEGEHNASQLFREIKPQGYCGGSGMVSLWAAQQRGECKRSRTTKTEPKQPKPTIQRPWSAAYAVWLLLKDPELLPTEKKAALERMLQTSPEVQRAYNFAQAFGRIVRGRLSKALDPWLKAVTQSGLAPLKTFAAGLERDKTAVSAALSLPWSQGQTEGQVNRLKLIKRQMYGRAKFDLLRLRVLAT